MEDAHVISSPQFRQGTQTLIQALQAIPWEEGEQDDDDLTPPSDPAEVVSDEEAGMTFRTVLPSFSDASIL